MKYGIEGGRTITIDGKPSLYINIATEPKNGRYAVVPADADDLARKIVALLNGAEGDSSELALALFGPRAEPHQVGHNVGTPAEQDPMNRFGLR